MTTKEAKDELDSIYEKIGGNEIELTDAILNRINELEAIVNPPRAEYINEDEPKGCGCGMPDHCWECAAIRGGCPMDV